MNLNIEIELQALITEREGMVAENKIRESLGHSIAYDEMSFAKLAEEMRALAIPAFIVPEGTLEKPLDCKPGRVIMGNRCASCNKEIPTIWEKCNECLVKESEERRRGSEEIELTDTSALQCSICNTQCTKTGKIAGDICERVDCPGILGKG